MDIATFRLQFPAFSQTDGKILQAKLNEASARMGGPDQRRWGSYSTAGQPLTQADFAQGNLAAYYLICDPMGTETRMDPTKAKESTYFKKWEELMYSVTPGITVAGRRRWSRFGGC